MGPTNLSLVKLFEADQALRDAQRRYDAAARNVRIQERKVKDLQTRHADAVTRRQQGQAHAATLEVDLKARDAHIEKLRDQQQNSRNNREYQALLLEINTQKIDRNKVEDAAIKAMEEVEKTEAEVNDLASQLEHETSRLEAMRSEISDRLAELQAEIDRLQPQRDAAAAEVPPTAAAAFDRLAERYEGEALAALTRTHPRREEYACTACNMDVVTDVYNRLHTRDELVACPSCGRLLYIPEDLTPDQAINKKKPAKTKRARNVPGAAVGRQTSAADVLDSMNPDEDDNEDAAAQEPSEASSADQVAEDQTANQPSNGQ